MHKFILLLSICLIGFSCTNITIGEIELNLNDPINLNNQGYKVINGSKTIFVYIHFLENSFDIIDDEQEIRILFQIDEDSNSFLIKTAEEFENSKFIYAECGVAFFNMVNMQHQMPNPESSGLRSIVPTYT